MNRAAIFSALLFLARPALVRGYEWQPFVDFLPVYADAFADEWHDNCTAQLAVPHSQSAWCESILDCVLENTSESVKTNMAGAAILLGLAPTILGTLAPALEDLALLGGQRPLLALLLAAGTPSLSAAKPLGDASPLEPLLNRLRSARGVFAGGARRGNDAAAIAINVAEYVIAIACAANVVDLSLDLMWRTVVSWSCPNWGWVIGWSSIPTALYFLAMLLFRYTVRPASQASADDPGTQYRDEAKNGTAYSRVRDHPSDAVDDLEPRRDMRPQPRDAGGPLGFLWRHEFQPCAQRRLPHLFVKRTWYVQLLRWVLPLGCYIQYVMGTAILASLFPVVVRDAFPILVRYSVSGAVAHIIAAFELRSLGERNGGEAWDDWEWVGERKRKLESKP